MSLTFVLEGVGGLYNYGCEAIVRGTGMVLRQKWPDCSIIYVSRRYDEDRAVLYDADIEVLSVAPPVPLAKRLINTVMRRLRLPFRVRHSETYHWLDDVDCVLSIGGDLFTLRSNEEAATRFHRVERTHKIMDSGKPLVLWGASVGPFEANPYAVEAFSNVLQRMMLIAAREPATTGYLEQLGIEKNVSFMADPAYVMSVAPKPARVEPTVAVNFSPLSADYTYGQEHRAEALKTQADTVMRLIQECSVNVLLVPHVVCPWRPVDDDYGYLAALYRSIPEEFRERVELLPTDLGARQTKRVISSCECVISTRMHCAIAGLSMTVPTLLLSYSSKSIGMSEYVYGNRKWVLPVDASTESTLDAAKALLGQSAAIRSFLRERMVSIRADAFGIVDVLESVL